MTAKILALSASLILASLGTAAASDVSTVEKDEFVFTYDARHLSSDKGIQKIVSKLEREARNHCVDYGVRSLSVRLQQENCRVTLINSVLTELETNT